MLPKSTIFTLLIFLGLSGGLFFSAPLQAFAKTVYIQEDGDDSNDGSSDHPFETLEKAAEEVNEGDADEVRIGKGSFEGNVIFDAGVSIEGAGKGSTTITGALTFKKKTDLRKVSIRAKTHNAVTLGKNADAHIEDVDIRDYIGVGIWMTAGSATLTLEDSRLGASGGKGIYAEAGSKLNMNGNTIINNKQEGIDIRQNTRGSIKNNTIENNSESGIELILGSSDFIISGNSIKKNGASGIAFQFYELNKKSGAITVTGNTISNNHKYGIDCKKPQGGNAAAGYWADSITLDSNTFSGNKGEISTACKLLEAKTEEEEKALEEQIAEEEKVEEQKEETKTESTEEQKIAAETVQAEMIVEEIKKVINDEEYWALQAQINQRKPYDIFLYGWQSDALRQLKEKVTTDEQELLQRKGEVAALEAYASRVDLQEQVAGQERRLSEYQTFLEARENKKGAAEYVSPDVLIRFTKLIHVFIF